MLRFKLKELIAKREFEERRRLLLQEIAEQTGITRNTLSKVLHQHAKQGDRCAGSVDRRGGVRQHERKCRRRAVHRRAHGRTDRCAQQSSDAEGRRAHFDLCAQGEESRGPNDRRHAAREHGQAGGAASPVAPSRARGRYRRDRPWLPHLGNETVFHSPHVLRIARKIPREDSLLVEQTSQQDRKEWDTAANTTGNSQPCQ